MTNKKDTLSYKTLGIAINLFIIGLVISVSTLIIKTAYIFFSDSLIPQPLHGYLNQVFWYGVILLIASAVSLIMMVILKYYGK